MGQFSNPEYFMKPVWEPSKLLLRFLFFNAIVIFTSVVDMNVFLIKMWLYIPSDHSILLGRTILLGWCLLVSARQTYFYFTDPKCSEFLGSQAWTSLLIVMVESLIA